MKPRLFHAHWRVGNAVTAWSHPDGIWTSRRLRKGHGPLKGCHYRPLSAIGMLHALVHPKNLERLEVRTALAFIVGSVLFVIGSDHQRITDTLSVEVFTIGSLLYLAGAWWQLVEARLADRHLRRHGLRWEWSGLRCAETQALGALLFTVPPVVAWLWPQASSPVWLSLEVLPNLIGCILFVTSAAYAVMEVGHGRLLVFEPRHLAWWITVVSGSGCVLFLLAALAGLPRHYPQQMVLNDGLADGATVVGAFAFVLAGLLTMAECSEDDV